MLRNLAAGDVASCDLPHDKDGVPEKADKAEPYDVNAKLIRWLCVDPKASKLVDPRGIQLFAARIVGELDLSFIAVPFPLYFGNSRFIENLNVLDAKVPALNLKDTWVLGILGDGVKVDNALFLGNGFRSEGDVRLPEAQIGGDLDASGGSFLDPGGDALSADGLKVSGGVYLRDGFRSEGDVRFLGANIGGDFDASGGSFLNHGGKALTADRLKVTGAVFLSEGFRSEGELSLLGANIGGDLDAAGGSFLNHGGDALKADGLKVTGNVFLTDGFRSDGNVRLLEANIGRDLVAAGGSFLNHGGGALSADRLKVTGNVFLTDGFRSDGEVRLPGADIVGDLILRGAHFAGKSRLNAERATVKGGFYWQGLIFEKYAQVELDMVQAKVGVLLDDREGWKANLDLDGLDYSISFPSPKDAESRLRWLEAQRKDEAWTDFSTQPYENLAKVLGEAGDSSGEKRVLIAMEDARRQYGSLGWPRWFWWFWSWVLKITIGYGYAPLLALVWIAGFLTLGTILFFFGHMFGAITLSKAKQPQYYRPFNSFVYSLETFLPLVELDQAKLWKPDSEQSAFGRLLRVYLWFHILFGWFFTSMLIAGITGLVHRS